MPRKNKRQIRAQDLYKIEVVTDVRISPNGEHVVYSKQRIDPKTEKKFSNLWLVPAGGGKAKDITPGNHKNYQPRWSPNGKRIAWLSDRMNPEKPAQIYEMKTAGSKLKQITNIDGQITSLSWSPDGKKLLCRIRKLDKDQIRRQADKTAKELGVVSRHYGRVFFKYDSEGYLPKDRWHLYIIDIKSGEAKQLTDHKIFDDNDPMWSPDGKSIAFMSVRTQEPDFDRDAVDLLLIPSQGGEARKIGTEYGEKKLPSFSPNGKLIAYFGTPGSKKWYKNQGLWIVPSDGSSKAINLTLPYDLHVDPVTINDIGAPEIMPPTWSSDGTKIYFPVMKHGRSLLCSIGVDGNNLETITGEQGVVGSYSFNADQTRMAFFMGKIDDPGQIYMKNSDSKITNQITKFNRKLLNKIELASIEEVWIQGPDQNDLQGWIMKPPGFDPERKYPSILEIHGGPLTQYGEFFMHEFYFLAASGYVVHFCNPRGGRGYGEDHAKAIHGNWGDADYRDLMAWTDFMERQPYIDHERMGVTGGSYGGYMTVWIIGHTDRFKAAVTQRCVSNFVSMWGSSDLNWVFQELLDDKPPFENLEKYWHHSPMKYIGNAKTPTLVIHSENDLRCPIEQGEQVFVALKSLGVDSEMVRFPDEFHGLSRNGRTDRRIVRLNHIVRWFDRYLK